MNSRHLTYQSDNPRDIHLTPSQLAWGRDLTLISPLLQPGDPLDDDYDAKATRAQYVVLSNALERFRKRWHSEYLLSLREKHYNQCAENPSHHLRVRQLVMVKHDNIHHIEWPLGVISATYPDERGVIWTVEVECGRRSTRSVTFLVPLELDCHQDDGEIRQRLRDDDDNSSRPVDSTSEAGGQGSPTTTAQQMQRNGAFLTASHTPSQHHFIRRAAPERAVQPLAPTHGAISPLRVTLALPTRFPYLPHQPHQLSSSLQRVRGGTRGRGSQ